MTLIECKIPDELRNATKQPPINLVARESDDGVELTVHGAIGEEDGLMSGHLRGWLKERKGKPVHVAINSPGGYVGDAIAIANALAQHDAPTTATIEGQAYSAATVIAAACDTVRMYENASYMIHNSWGLAIGNRHAMAEYGEIMEQLDQQIAVTLAAHSNLSAEKVRELMDGDGKKDGTYMDAAQALEYGFVDEVLPVKDRQSKKDKAKDAAPAPVAVAGPSAEAVAVRLRTLDLD